MSTIETECGICNKSIPRHIRIIKCDICERFFHVKCCKVMHNEFKSIKGSNSEWHCKHCEHINTSLDVPSYTNKNIINSNNAANNSNECGGCNKKIPNHLKNIKCDKCKIFFHVKCCGITKKKILRQ